LELPKTPHDPACPARYARWGGGPLRLPAISGSIPRQFRTLGKPLPAPDSPYKGDYRWYCLGGGRLPVSGVQIWPK
jgi:hypothetical protein